MRIRSNCCLWGKPEAYSGRGRPRKHGQKFKVNDPTTWWKTGRKRSQKKTYPIVKKSYSRPKKSKKDAA